MLPSALTLSAGQHLQVTLASSPLHLNSLASVAHPLGTLLELLVVVAAFGPQDLTVLGHLEALR